MLRPSEDLCEKCVDDGLVRKLHGINCFVYTTAPRSQVGVFFVWKSNRTELRLITDCRPTSQLFREAPRVTLTTAEGFGRIELEMQEGAWVDSMALTALDTFVRLF